jgi:hypothetical protein
MFTFVLSSGLSGRGDFFTEMAIMVGMSRPLPSVAHLYGKRVERFELELEREQRKLSSQFMTAALEVASNKVYRDVFGPQSPFDQETKNRLNSLAQGWQSAMLQGGTGVSFILDQFSNMVETTFKDKRNQAELIGQLVAVLRHQMQEMQKLLQPQDDLYPNSRLYFGGSTTAQGLLDFMIWRHEADRLGIRLTMEDVRDLINKEAFNKLDQSDFDLLQRRVGGMQRGRMPIDLGAGLTDEFRVRLAQLAILGYDPGSFSHVPALITPDEFWQYYHKNRTDVSVRFLDIPVESFLAQVKDKPTDEDLKKLYDQHKDEEYSPTKDSPGFKLSRRIKVEWASASADSEYYKKAARQWILSFAAGIPASPILGIALSYPLMREYSDLTQFGSQLKLPPWTEKDFASSLYSYAYSQKPESAAGVVGQIAAAVATSAAPMAGVDSRQTAALSILAGQPALALAAESKELSPAVAEVARGRVPAAAAFLMANPVASPLVNAMTLGGTWQQAKSADQHLPIQVVKEQLLRKVEQNLASELVTSTLAKFKQELETKRARPKEAAEFAAAQIKLYGWKHGIAQQLEENFQIADDPGLAGLKAGFYSGSGISDDSKGKQFASRLFSDQTSSLGQPKATEQKLYTPSEIFGSHATFVYWTTEDQPARDRTFAEARDKVEAAWRLSKARELADAEAKKIADQARQTKGDPLPRLIEESTRVHGKIGSLDGISRLRKSPTPTPGMEGDYSPYKVPEAVIEYPPNDFTDQVLKLKEKGDVLVLSDQPKSRYFVVALSERIEPTMKDFYDNTNPGLQTNPLLHMFEQEKRKEYRRDAIVRLREQARLKLSDDPKLLQQVEEKGSAGE